MKAEKELKITWPQYCLIAHALICAIQFVFSEIEEDLLQFTISWVALMVTCHIDERERGNNND